MNDQKDGGLRALAQKGAVLLSAAAVTATCLAIAPAAQALESPAAVEATELVEAPTALVEAPAEARAIAPGRVSVTGTAAIGAELLAQTQDWEAGATLGYQWLRDGVPIDGATAERYVVAAADGGARLQVAVTASQEGSEPVTVTSEQITIEKALQAGSATIAGPPEAGKTLTANPGAWPAGTSLAYQWLRNGAPIAGATGTGYLLTAADSGTRISVTVTGSLAGHTTTSKTSAEILVLRPLTAATPQVSGTLKVGQTLKAAPGSWTAGTKLAYQWLRAGKAIVGATGSSYQLAAADGGTKISVRVTGSQAGYVPSAKTSAATAVVPKALKTAVPAFTGKAIVGTTLQAKRGTWTSGVTFTYRWYRNGAPIKSGSFASYKLVSADAGKRITLRVTGSKSGYTAEGRMSAQSAVIKRPSQVVWRQTDPRWRNVRVGAGYIGPTGCVPTAFAMALWSEGVKASPLSVALTMHRKGDYNRSVSGAGSRSIVVAAKHYGVKAAPVKSLSALRSSLQSGRTVIGLVGGPSSITRPGSTHAIVLTGLTSKSTTFVRNPYGGAANQHYATSTLWSHQSRDRFDWNAGAVFWQIG